MISMNRNTLLYRFYNNTLYKQNIKLRKYFPKNTKPTDYRVKPTDLENYAENEIFREKLKHPRDRNDVV